jgi:hypothetical protein
MLVTLKNKDMIAKVISAGRHGADLGALRAAKQLNIVTGGWMPMVSKERLTENLSLMEAYNLSQSPIRDIKDHIGANIRGSHVTLIFAAKEKTPGIKQIINICKLHRKMYFLVDPYSELAAEKVKEVLRNVHNRYGKSLIVHVTGYKHTNPGKLENRVEQVLQSALADITQLPKAA